MGDRGRGNGKKSLKMGYVIYGPTQNCLASCFFDNSRSGLKCCCLPNSFTLCLTTKFYLSCRKMHSGDFWPKQNEKFNFASATVIYFF